MNYQTKSCRRDMRHRGFSLNFLPEYYARESKENRFFRFRSGARYETPQLTKDIPKFLNGQNAEII